MLDVTTIGREILCTTVAIDVSSSLLEETCIRGLELPKQFPDDVGEEEPVSASHDESYILYTYK